MVASMNVEELKHYLRVRNLRLTGRKQELVARVFSAMENGVEPVKSAVEIDAELKAEYLNKLKLDDGVIPDPFMLSDGWMNETDGLKFWPMLLYPDIFNYLMFFPSELGSKDLSDYKNCKAYSYFKSGWLDELFYHGIDEKSKFCILKAECRKSQNIRDTNHKLWLVIEKKSAHVRSCHCTCMAGMSETCNHVAAAMFRIEAAVRNGLTNPACTSSKNQWLPSRQEVGPVKVKNLNFNREDFGQRGKTKRPLVSTPKKSFNPLVASNRCKMLTLSDIGKALQEVAPESILFTALPKPKVDFVREILTKNTCIPPNVVSIDDILLMSENINTFKANLSKNMTLDNINLIEKCTHGQSSNETWYHFRKGVVTASKSHDVFTKMTKVNKGCISVDLWPLHQKISGSVFVSPDIPALKYGRVMEENAVNHFFDIMKKKHKNLQIQECGLFLDKTVPFIGGSPDRIITCTCCEPACLEVKCPYSINHLSPTDPKADLAYLVKDVDKIELKKNHRYYTQCQVQMAVTGFNHSYFMVWTPHGFVIDHMLFDQERWYTLKLDLVSYYNNYYLKTIFGE